MLWNNIDKRLVNLTPVRPAASLSPSPHKSALLAQLWALHTLHVFIYNLSPSHNTSTSLLHPIPSLPPSPTHTLELTNHLDKELLQNDKLGFRP